MWRLEETSWRVGSPRVRRNSDRSRGSRYVKIISAGAAVALIVPLCASPASASGSTPSSPTAVVRGTGTHSDALLPETEGWGTSWSYNPFSPNFAYTEVGPGSGYMPLAIQVPPYLTKFVPQLATRWGAVGNKLTIDLRSDAHWQNGAPFTSKDVYDTILLDGTEGNSLWNDIANLAAPSPTKIVLTLRKGVPAALAENDLFNGVTPVPSSVYGKYVTPSLKQDDITYYTESATNPTAAAKLPQKNAIDSLFERLAKFNPRTFVGDGPFELVSMNTSEGIMKKWSGFYGAARIHIGGLEFVNAGSNQEAYPEMFHGEVDISGVYMPPEIVKRWLKVPGARVSLAAGGSFDIIFNDHRYPLDLVRVRQALAYVIPRRQMIALTYGTTDAGGTLEKQPDGLTPGVESQWLSPKQIASLNTYPVDPAKAAALLKSAGFHKRGSQWIMPNGKQFTLGMTVNSASSDDVTCFEVAAKALTRFGIKTAVLGTTGAVETSDLLTGNFQIDFNGTIDPDPITEFDQMMGSPENFINLGTYKGDRGIGLGPVMTVPGLGRVNVPRTLDREAASVGTGPEMHKLAWDWARFVNQEVPYLQYGNKVWQMSYSTASFTHWPPARNPLWRIIDTNDNGLLLALERGYVRPKK